MLVLFLENRIYNYVNIISNFNGCGLDVIGVSEQGAAYTLSAAVETSG